LEKLQNVSPEARAQYISVLVDAGASDLASVSFLEREDVPGIKPVHFRQLKHACVGEPPRDLRPQPRDGPPQEDDEKQPARERSFPKQRRAKEEVDEAKKAVVLVLGPQGSGKSSLINFVAGKYLVCPPQIAHMDDPDSTLGIKRYEPKRMNAVFYDTQGVYFDSERNIEKTATMIRSYIKDHEVIGNEAVSLVWGVLDADNVEIYNKRHYLDLWHAVAGDLPVIVVLTKADKFKEDESRLEAISEMVHENALLFLPSFCGLIVLSTSVNTSEQQRVVKELMESTTTYSWHRHDRPIVVSPWDRHVPLRRHCSWCQEDTWHTMVQTSIFRDNYRCSCKNLTAKCTDCEVGMAKSGKVYGDLTCEMCKRKKDKESRWGRK